MGNEWVALGNLSNAAWRMGLAEKLQERKGVADDCLVCEMQYGCAFGEPWGGLPRTSADEGSMKPGPGLAVQSKQQEHNHAQEYRENRQPVTQIWWVESGPRPQTGIALRRPRVGTELLMSGGKRFWIKLEV